MWFAEKKDKKENEEFRLIGKGGTSTLRRGSSDAAHFGQQHDEDGTSQCREDLKFTATDREKEESKTWSDDCRRENNIPFLSAGDNPNSRIHLQMLCIVTDHLHVSNARRKPTPGSRTVEGPKSRPLIWSRRQDQFNPSPSPLWPIIPSDSHMSEWDFCRVMPEKIDLSLARKTCDIPPLAEMRLCDRLSQKPVLCSRVYRERLPAFSVEIFKLNSKSKAKLSVLDSGTRSITS